MIIRGRNINVVQLSCLVVYYGFARFLPVSYTPIVGFISKKIRYVICRRIFKSCGPNVNIERMASFGSGLRIEIGENSGIGVGCHIPSDTKIGKNVMMGPNCHILSRNHAFERVDISIREQGFTPPRQTVIFDDVWIGRDVLMTPGRTIRTGSIIAAGTILCKDFPEYSIIGGNPSRLIRSRLK